MPKAGKKRCCSPTGACTAALENKQNQWHHENYELGLSKPALAFNYGQVSHKAEER